MAQLLHLHKADYKAQVDPPSSSEISTYLTQLLEAFCLDWQVCVISFAYLQRLPTMAVSDWKCLIYATVLLAAKYTTNLHVWACDFSTNASSGAFGLEETVEMEFEVMERIGFRLYVAEAEF